MRWTSAAAILALTVPFVFIDASYLSEQYREWLHKLISVASAPPSAWRYPADFASMLDAASLLQRPTTLPRA
jgi:hypothetical protein